MLGLLFVFAGMGVAFFYNFGVGAFIFFIGLIILAFTATVKNDMKYIEKAQRLISDDRISDISSIAKSIDKSYADTVRLVNKMVKMGALRSGYLDQDLGRFVYYDEVKEKPKIKVEPKIVKTSTTNKPERVVKCPCCGAPNTIKGNSGECEYCGSPLE